MATDAKVASMGLREVLDGLLVAHRQDIHAYGSGHLNESNLVKPTNAADRRSWPSAKKPIQVKKRTKLRSSLPSQKPETMKETLATFSLGTAGGLGPQKKSGAHAKPSTSVERTDTVLIQELELPDVMLENVKYPSSDPHPPTMFGWTKDEAVFPSKHCFIPGHQGAVTKKDAYESMMEFQRDVLRKQDTTERHVLSGQRVVTDLEDRLRQDLEQLTFDHVGPNFHRLQVYSRTFDELIQKSATFGYMLGTIKDEYDDFVAALLDSQPGKHRALHDQVQQLSSRNSVNPETLDFEMKRLKGKEEEAQLMIEMNERLRTQLMEEEEKTSQAESESMAPTRHMAPIHSSSMDIVDHVEDLRCAIWQKMDEVSALKVKLHDEYVPATVCNQLEQCIKETEVELQKLQSQKEYFERSVSELDTDLRSCIEEADTTEKDEKRVWKKILHVKGSSSSEADDENDENKWNWYIS